jgi:hypothetical protein
VHRASRSTKHQTPETPHRITLWIRTAPSKSWMSSICTQIMDVLDSCKSWMSSIRIMDVLDSVDQTPESWVSLIALLVSAR